MLDYLHESDCKSYLLPCRERLEGEIESLLNELRHSHNYGNSGECSCGHHRDPPMR